MIEGYLKDMKVGEDEIEKKSCYRHFRMGETTYLSEVEIRFPIVLKTDNGDYMKREVTAYIIDADRVNFLLGKETMKEWEHKIDQTDDILSISIILLFLFLARNSLFLHLLYLPLLLSSYILPCQSSTLLEILSLLHSNMLSLPS